MSKMRMKKINQKKKTKMYIPYEQMFEEYKGEHIYNQRRRKVQEVLKQNPYQVNFLLELPSPEKSGERSSAELVENQLIIHISEHNLSKIFPEKHKNIVDTLKILNKNP